MHIRTCQICGGSRLVKVLDLGKMPAANAFLTKAELQKTEEKFPLRVYFCKTCSSLQLLDIVNPKILFRHYTYLTSASKPLISHFEEMGKELAKRFVTDKNDLVVEIGGNDGILLSAIADKCRTINIEPAANIAKISAQKGITTISKFFDRTLARELVKKYGRAKVVVANNVMAHIFGLKDVFCGVADLIGEDGVFVFEVHWVGNLLGEGGFDQVYHEHLFYHSLTALTYLARAVGLRIIDVQPVHMHGQSMRVFAAKNMPVKASVKRFLDKEKNMGLDKAATYLKFSRKVEQEKKELLSLLKKLKKEGKTIVGYGAPAKGNILLNYFGIDGKTLDYVTDTTPLKQGKYTPGMHILVSDPERLTTETPDYVLLLAWNYRDAILEKEKSLRKKGVKFIIPVNGIQIV